MENTWRTLTDLSVTGTFVYLRVTDSLVPKLSLSACVILCVRFYVTAMEIGPYTF